MLRIPHWELRSTPVQISLDHGEKFLLLFHLKTHHRVFKYFIFLPSYINGILQLKYPGREIYVQSLGIQSSPLSEFSDRYVIFIGQKFKSLFQATEEVKKIMEDLIKSNKSLIHDMARTAIQFHSVPVTVYPLEKCLPVKRVHPTERIEADFPETRINKVAFASRHCSDGTKVAEMICKPSTTIQYAGEWDEPDWSKVKNCYKELLSNWTENLEIIKGFEIKRNNILHILEIVHKRTKNSILNSYQISLVFSIFENINKANITFKHYELRLATEIVNHLLRKSGHFIKEAYELFNSTHHITFTISKMAKTFNWVSSSKCVRFPGYKFTIVVCKGYNLPINGFSVAGKSLHELRPADIDQALVVNENNFTEVENGVYFGNLSLLMPKDRIIFYSYSGLELFPTKKSNKVTSIIVGIEISGYGEKLLKNPVVTVFKAVDQVRNWPDYRCESWNFAKSRWMKEDCKPKKYFKDRMFCECAKFSHYSIQISKMKEKNLHIMYGPILSIIIIFFVYIIPLCKQVFSIFYKYL